MAISSGNIVYYSDLINYVKNNFLSQCNNIDGYSVRVPDAAKPDFTYTRHNSDWHTTVKSHYGYHGLRELAYGVRVRIVNDTVLGTVSQSDALNDFTAFLNSKGFNTRTGKIEGEGMPILYNVCASFFAARLIYEAIPNFGMGFGNYGALLMYKGGSVSYPNISIDVGSASLTQLLNDLLNTINKYIKVHMIRYTVESYFP